MGLCPSLAQILLIGSMPRRPQEEPLPHLPATFWAGAQRPSTFGAGGAADKTFPPQGFSAEWQWLQARAAEDSRIVLVAESMPGEELLVLYGCCDAFLALHRCCAASRPKQASIGQLPGSVTERVSRGYGSSGSRSQAGSCGERTHRHEKPRPPLAVQQSQDRIELTVDRGQSLF